MNLISHYGYHNPFSVNLHMNFNEYEYSIIYSLEKKKKTILDGLFQF